VVERLVTEVSDAAENYCGRAFLRTSRTETLRPPVGHELWLKHTPISGTPTITLDGSAVTDFTVHDATAGLLWRDSGWGGATYGEDVEDSVALAQVHGAAEPILLVTYTGGYVMPSESSATNGSPITVTHVGTGTGTITASGITGSVQTVVGTVDAYNPTLLGVVVGAADSVAVRIEAGSTIDLGSSYPGSASVGLTALDGVLLAFSATGTWVAEDTFSFTTTATSTVSRTYPWDVEGVILQAVVRMWRALKSGQAKVEFLTAREALGEVDGAIPGLDPYRVLP
jgi:hypothetical protein